MNIINVRAACVGAMGNTGVGLCSNDFSITRGVIQGPLGVPVPATTIAAFKAFILAAILADVPSQRVRPIQDIIEIVVGGGEPITFTEPATQKVRQTADGYMSKTFSFSKGGQCLTNSLIDGNGQNMGFMEFDENGVIRAASSDTPDSVEFAPMDFYAMPTVDPTQPSEIPKHRFMLSYDPYWTNKGAAFIDLSKDGGLRWLKNLNGLQNVTLYQNVARALGVIKVGAKTDCDTVNLYDLYAAELADLTAFVVENAAAPYAVVPITSVVVDATNKGWTITLNPNTYAPAVTVRLAGPTVLDGLGVPRYETPNKLAQ